MCKTFVKKVRKNILKLYRRKSYAKKQGFKKNLGKIKVLKNVFLMLRKILISHNILKLA